MDEDVTTVSPTLGFIIKTIDFKGYFTIFKRIIQDIMLTGCRYKLNICEEHHAQWLSHNWRSLGDVGGQKTLRSYWRNYFEKTDTLVWVVDATDRLRVEDCRQELAGLLLEEVLSPPTYINPWGLGANATLFQRLMGASLLVYLNKTDVEGCMTEHEVREVREDTHFRPDHFRNWVDQCHSILA